MKKGLLTCLSLAFGLAAMAQPANRLPQGFKRAEVPATIKNMRVPVPNKVNALDNGTPFNNIQSRQWVAPQQLRSSTVTVTEETIGFTYYDLQTNGASGNRLVRNDDGTFSAAWTFSPDATSGFPLRGTGYNYYNGTSWGSIPGSRIENVRSGFTNVMTTQSGKELTISHSGTNMIMAGRPTKGTGAWTTNTTIFGTANNDTWSKAVAGGVNGETIHAIWQGTGSTTVPFLGQLGPLFYSRSTDGGVTWNPLKRVIDLVDSTQYFGFGGDAYSIDVRGNTVAIAIGDFDTDVLLLKSTDGGDNWTKTIIQTFPIPLYNADLMMTDVDLDGIADTIVSNGGDPHVLLDHTGMAHVWFSANRVLDDDTTGGLSYFPGTDGLFYWNETMLTDDYAFIAESEDFSGDGVLNTPTSGTCSFPWGLYRGGITQMPTAGIDANGTLYVTYQTINELADTSTYSQAHRHIYMITSSDNGATWTHPFNILLPAALGGDPDFQETVFATMARVVDSKAYVIFQRDEAPGHALAAAGTCDVANNLGNPSELVFATVDATTVRVNKVDKNNVAVSQNYPNPSTGLTSINVNLNKASDLRLEVVDVMGRTIFVDSKKNAASGNHTLVLNTANWNSGMYFYSVTTNAGKVTKQLMVK